jgi:hypothetical protein
MLVPSIGVILQIMPSLPISMVIRHIIGIMLGIIAGNICMPIAGMPIVGIPIMGIPIMGIPIMGIPIMGIPIPCIAIPGIMPAVIGVIAGIIEPIVGIIECCIGIAGMFMAGIMAVPSSSVARGQVAPGEKPRKARCPAALAFLRPSRGA